MNQKHSLNHSVPSVQTVLTGNASYTHLVNETWSMLPSPALDLPTTRAGNSAFVYRDLLLVVRGESLGRLPAHNEVEVLDMGKMKWLSWHPLSRGRHGKGIVMYQEFLYTCAGSGNYGGGPELLSTERFDIGCHYEVCCSEP